MKKLIAVVLVCLILLPICACSRRGEERPAPSKKPETNVPTEETLLPVSGTDLYVPEPLSAEAQESLDGLRRLLKENNAACGIAYITHADPNVLLPEFLGKYNVLEESGYAESYPFMGEMTAAQCLDTVFSDLYCLVPLDENAAVLIEELVMDSESGEPIDQVAKVLYESNNGAPVLLTSSGNGWGGSNVRVTITDSSGGELRFFAAMWSNSGTVCEQEGLFDFTLYPESVAEDVYVD